MKFRAVSWLWVFSLLLACGQGIAATSIPTKPSSTLTSTTTVIPSPTITSSPTATSFPPLSGNPPYLIMRQGYDPQEFIIYDHDGSGRRIIELPKDGHLKRFPRLDKIISPDGKWLAFYKGSVAISEDPDNLPVTLYILNVADGTTRKIADVVIEDYQKKLEEVAENLKRLDPNYYQPVDGKDWVTGSTIVAFKLGIYSVTWSPDSRYLAFAGQIDGISSDVYVYDTESRAIQRVNDDVQNVSSIQWSPDGKFIVFENSIPGNVYDSGVSLHAVRFSNRSVKDPTALQAGTWWSTKEWLSPTVLLGAQGTDTAGEFDLQTIDISTRRINHLWKYSVSDYAIDYKNKVIAINTSELEQSKTLGIYLVTFNGSQRKVLNGLYWLSLFFRGGDKHRFLTTGSSYQAQYDLKGDVVGITSDNKLTFLGKFDNQHIRISPDYSWLLMYNDKGLYLYDKNDILTQTFSIPNIYEILWRPDSQGIFYSTGNEIYYLSIPDGKSKLIDQCTTENCGFGLDNYDAAWLQ